MSFSTRLQFISSPSPRSILHAVPILFNFRAGRAYLRSHGGLARAENARNFFGRQSLEVAKHKSRSFFGRESVQSLLDQSPLLRPDRVCLDVFVARQRSKGPVLSFTFKGSELMTAASLPHMIAAHVDDDSIQPRREVLIGAKPFQILVHSQEDFLGGIPSVFTITQHSPGG